MGALRAKFDRPVPKWIKEVKKKGEERISRAKFIKDIQSGRKDVLKEEIYDLWPYIDVFPKIVGEKSIDVLMTPKNYVNYGVKDMIYISKRTVEIVRQIQKDEGEHKLLWLDTAKDLGILKNINAYYKKRKTLPWVRRWIEETIPRTENISDSFIKFAAIEIIAEGVSKHLLKSGKFRNMLSKKGIAWFHTHVMHHGDDLTHEELFWKIGIAFSKKKMSEENASKIVLNLIDTFIKASRDASENKGVT